MGMMNWLGAQVGAFRAGIASAVLKGTGDLTLRDKELIKLLGWRLPGDSELSDPYTQLATVYACITIKARNIANVPFKLYERSNAQEKFIGGGLREKMMLLKTKAAEGAEVTSGAPWLVFQKPNQMVSRYQFWESLFTDLDSYGEWFVAKDREEVDDFPAALWRRSPPKVKPAQVNGYWTGWTYVTPDKTETYKIEDVLHDKYPNPGDDLRGLSPLTALRITNETLYDSVRWNRAFFKNNATPDIAYTTDQALTRSQRLEITDALQKARENMRGAHKAILLEGGLKPQLLGYNQRDMQFAQLNSISKEEICMALHVPKSVLSMYEDANYAFSLSADRGFWTETLLPLMTRCEDEFNRMLLHPYGLEGFFDLQTVEALAYAWTEKIDAAVKLWGMQFTANEVNERLNLGFEEAPWRDHPFVPAGAPPEFEEEDEPAQPSSNPSGQDEPDEEDVEDDEDTAEEQDDEQEEVGAKGYIASEEIARGLREKKWREVAAEVRPIVGKFNRELKNYWHNVERRVMARITKSACGGVTKAFGKDNLNELDEAFDDAGLKTLANEYMGDTVTAGVLTMYKGDFKLINKNVTDAAGSRVAQIVGINETGREQLKASMTALMKQGAEEGWSEEKLATALFDTAKDQLRNMENRSRTQARTEMHGAFSEGRYLGAKESGAEKKMWVSSRDDRVRDTHEKMDGEVVDFDEQFTLPSGVKMAFPMDPDAEGAEDEIASETINCRCILVSIFGEDGPKKESESIEAEELSFEGSNIPADQKDWWSENAMAEGKSWYEKLDEPTQNAILEYKGSGYVRINKALRDPALMNDRVREKIELIDRAFENSPLGKKKITTFRGISESAAEKLWGEAGPVVGTQYTDRGFVSTTVNASFAASWESVLVRIRVPAEAGKAMYVRPHYFDSEMEVLLARHQRYEITGVGKVKIGYNEVKVVDVKLVPRNVGKPAKGMDTGGTVQTKAEKDRTDAFIWDEGDLEIVKEAK